ncbi:hypothetical protein HPB49_019438 [Dermacentor silvarum]|uniref:Uncharacterized protein n=1 Tax=Dermacentor silvarum TaxID=543639 RepID=A0ACB8DFB9_DERSI|nr:hypothetical protein HPB49_019438 [Dermacentor silvarum]
MAYILIFSCAVIRVIHLELTTSMTTTTTLLVFRRFVSRRGIHDTVYSDNALSFHSCARRPFCRLSKNTLLMSRPNGSSLQIELPGGEAGRSASSDRQKKKNALRRSLGRSSLKAEALSIILCEVEAVINRRPLTCLDSNPDELQPLTLLHFLLGRRAVCFPQEASISDGTPSARADLPRRACYRERLTVELWIRWKWPFLLLLRSAQHSPVR